MVIIAATLYLPQHITFLTNRAWFYYNGDESAKLNAASTVGASASGVVVETIRETIVKAVGSDAERTVVGGSREL